MVEIDRGTMPIRRSDPEQTSFEGKMRVYLAAHAAKQHERQFGRKNFRVLIVTTDHRRVKSMIEAVLKLHVTRSSAVSLFLFGTFGAAHAMNPLTTGYWQDSNGLDIDLI
jgi:hypothetical protein